MVVASANGSVGIHASVAVLRAGGSSLDAVVAGLELVEANPHDHTVGFSGLPNMLGEVELDACVTVGDGLRAGGVAALNGYQEAAWLARRVMDELPHSLLAGNGANRFAAESGLDTRDLSTPDSLAIWRSRANVLDPHGSANAEYYQRMRNMEREFDSDPNWQTSLWHGQFNLPGS